LAIKQAFKNSELIHKTLTNNSDEKLGIINLLQDPEFSFWTNWTPADWSIRSDGPMTSQYCLLVYVFSYSLSWITFSMLIAFLANNKIIRSTSRMSYIKSLTIACGLSTFTYSVIAESCTTTVNFEKGNCYHNSRLWFNFMWLGAILLVFGVVTGIKKQQRDKELESYVVKRQLERSSRQGKPDEESLEVSQSKRVEEVDDDDMTSKMYSSAILAPIKMEWQPGNTKKKPETSQMMSYACVLLGTFEMIILLGFSLSCTSLDSIPH